MNLRLNPFLDWSYLFDVFHYSLSNETIVSEKNRVHRDGAMHIETNCVKNPKILWDLYLSVPIDEFDYRFLNATVLRLQYRNLLAGHSLANKHTCTHWLMCTNLRQNARDNHNVMVLLIFFSLPFCPMIFRCRFYYFSYNHAMLLWSFTHFDLMNTQTQQSHTMNRNE